MGMFDTLEANNTIIKCKKCDQILNTEDGIQTKHFDNVLDYYKIGDVINGAKDKFYIDYEWCSSCGEKNDVMFGFLNEIYLGVYNTEDELDEVIKNFDIFELYKKSYNTKKKLSLKYNTLLSSIEKIIEFNTTKLDKQSHLLFLVKHRVSDYNPIEALKNLIKDNKKNNDLM